MLLYHKTTIDTIDKILKDGKLKPSTKTGIKSENPFNKKCSYIFFNTIPNNKLNYFKIFEVGIVFDYKILLNKVFYTNRIHSAGITDKSKKYLIKDNKRLNNILYNLYQSSLNNSKGMNKFILSIFQEVFTKYEPCIKDAKYIILNKKNNIKIRNIKSKYPNIKFLYS